MEWLFRHRQMKRAETDKPNLKLQRPALYSTLSFYSQKKIDLSISTY